MGSGVCGEMGARVGYGLVLVLIDRRTYMKFYLKNRSALKLHSVVLPLIAATGLDDINGELVLKPKLPTVDPS